MPIPKWKLDAAKWQRLRRQLSNRNTARALVVADLLRQDETWYPHKNISWSAQRKMRRQTLERWGNHGRYLVNRDYWENLISGALSKKADGKKTDLEVEYEKLTGKAIGDG